MCNITTDNFCFWFEFKYFFSFRLYDADNSDSIEEEELEDVFVRLCNIATNIENAQKRARNPELEKPPTPPPQACIEGAKCRSGFVGDCGKNGGCLAAKLTGAPG